VIFCNLMPVFLTTNRQKKPKLKENQDQSKVFESAPWKMFGFCRNA